MQETIGFIGAGNMANSLIGGLISNGYPAHLICASDPNSEKLTALHQNYKIHTTENNHDVIAKSSVIIFAVKPQDLGAVAKTLAADFNDTKHLIISIAAGVHTHYLSRCLNRSMPIIRCMPNTPSLLQAGATALFANPHVLGSQRNLAESIMRSVGITVWLDDEKEMDTVTALSGSGPAYFFFIMEALEQAATAQGLAKETAHLLTIQTALGAARMALESDESITQLRTRVTSPGGTTEQAINVFESAQLGKILADAVHEAKQRAIELGTLLET